MQLAATPRPHPPPVPPRPSRQVVAEALKRSPRPPCPTRQAPPPPDTKPWRAKDRENGPRRGPSRTVVYDSVGKPKNVGEAEQPVEKSGGEPEEKNTESVRRGDEHHHHHQQQQQQQQQNSGKQLTAAAASPRAPSERSDRNTAGNNNSSIPSPNTNTNTNPCGNNTPPQRLSQPPPPPPPLQRPTPAERHQQISHSNLRVHQLRLAGIPTSGESISPVSQAPIEQLKICPEAAPTSPPKLINQRKIQVVNGAVVFEARNPLVKPPAPPRPVDNCGENLNSVKEADNRKKDSSPSPLPLQGENSETGTDSEDEKTVKGSPLSGISSEDCATVVQVVVDETERRVAFDESVNIQHEDWFEAGVLYSSTKITLSGDEIPEETLVDPPEEEMNGFHSPDEEELICTFDFASIREKIAMSSLQGLPPLPRSLSGFNLNAPSREGNEPPPPPARSSSRPQRGTRPTQPTGRPPPPPQGGRQLTTLDTQLAKLRREMFGLRQLDLSLLSQLWSLNESIQEFRQLLQEQDDRAPSPSPSSEEGDDTSYGSHPPPHPRRPPPVTHHHRTPRPLPRNDSPSSEEYGAV